MSESGQLSRVLANVQHGGHVLVDTANNADQLAATQENISTRSSVIQQPAERAAKAGTTAFGYLFKDLADAFPANHLPGVPQNVIQGLNELGAAMVEGFEEPPPPPPNGPPRPSLNSPIPPIYTYWGQFIDHDLTLATDNDSVIPIIGPDLPPVPPHEVVKKLSNMRTPALNLDSVYGDGPFAPEPPPGKVAVKYDGIKLQLGQLTQVGLGQIPPVDDLERDLPRGDNAVALIGDHRNDENLVVAQLHVAFLRFHNAAVDWVRANERERVSDPEVFLRARDLTRWTYQWLVVHDYLRTVARTDVVDHVETSDSNLLDLPGRGVYMPIEFSVAAFRFGHSMVRGGYDWNRNFGRPGNNGRDGASLLELFQFTGKHNPPMAFGLPSLPDNWPAEWDRMVDKDSLFSDRFARRIDTQIAPPLSTLANEGNSEQLDEQMRALLKHLARRNLLRGYRLSAPTGQAVAGALGVVPLSKDELLSNAGAKMTAALENNGFLDATPLWFYILKEAEVHERGSRLGKVGSRIIAETIIAQLRADPGSYLNQTSWGPAQGVRLRNGQPVRSIADFLRFAGVLA
jgi:Animal haem peroxidase